MILAIDSSTKWMGIALSDGSQIQYEKVWRASRRHTVELSPAIEKTFLDCSISPQDLRGVAVATGPGSFTSLRIGLAVAKGFALSRHIPIIGVPSLDITARGIHPQNKVLVCVLRAGRNRLAAQHYLFTEQGWKRDGEVSVATAAELEQAMETPTIICGEMDEDEKKILSRRWRNAIIAEPPNNVRRPGILAQIAYERLETDDVDDSATIAPIYLRTVKNIDH